LKYQSSFYSQTKHLDQCRAVLSIYFPNEDKSTSIERKMSSKFK